MGKFFEEFKAFAVKGNAVDMAVGVIIGGAFGKIVSSIVDDIIMPPIGWLIGGVNFSDLKVTLPTVEIPGVEKMSAATINYGNFIQTLLDFVIIAFCVLVSEYVVEKVFRMCIGEACIKSAISSGNSKRHNCSTVCCRRDSARKPGSNRNSNLKSLPTTTT